jgi:hypothetical protein
MRFYASFWVKAVNRLTALSGRTMPGRYGILRGSLSRKAGLIVVVADEYYSTSANSRG